MAKPIELILRLQKVSFYEGGMQVHLGPGPANNTNVYLKQTVTVADLNEGIQQLKDASAKESRSHVGWLDLPQGARAPKGFRNLPDWIVKKQAVG